MIPKKNLICRLFRPTNTTIICTFLFFISISPINAEVITFTDSWGNAGFNLLSQDVDGITIVFSIDRFLLEDFIVEGEPMQMVVLPGVFLPREEGAPNLPSLSKFIALPQDANVIFEVLERRTEKFDVKSIIPSPPITLENSQNRIPLYKKDTEIYSQNAFYPKNPVIISGTTKIRGVDVIQLGINPFQYNPVTGEMLVHRDIRLRIDFIGGNNHFGEDRLRSRYWDPILKNCLLNYNSLPEMNYNRVALTDDDNVEYLIIVPDEPVFTAWADSIKFWRNQQGIITGVTTLTEIGGNDAGLIETYINNAYFTWDIPPVAILLLSDYQNSGDVYGITAPVWNSYCVSDNIYGDVNGNDLPDIVMSRMTAQNEAHLSSMITKLLDYERNPPANPGFYLNPMTVGGWQDDSWFILCTEICGGFMHNVLGKEPRREYGIISGTPGNVWSTNPYTAMVVAGFGPQGLGYIPEDPSYLTDWDANAASINDGINDGAFLLLHRDHGCVDGWGCPTYNINDLNGLSNDDPVFVFSMDCLTGKFNYSTTCFTEQFHRMGGGALGLISATETTYSMVTDVFTWGVWDGLFPEFLPDHDPQDLTGSTDLRPAFANVSAKYYLQESTFPLSPAQKTATYHLFHHHGDVFTTLYTEEPEELTVSHPATIMEGINQFTVSADAGAIMSLTVNNVIIGSAESSGGANVIDIEPQLAGSTILVTVTLQNYYRYMEEVPVINLAGLLISIEPQVTPIVIPPAGGSFDFNLNIVNVGTSTVIFDGWTDVILPDSSIFGPILLRRELVLETGASIARIMTQIVPGNAPAGIYAFSAHVGDYPGVILDEDSFTFEKTAVDENEVEEKIPLNQ